MNRFALAAMFVSIPALSFGSALFGSMSLDAGFGATVQNVAVGPCSSSSSTPGAFCIDFDYTGGSTTNGTTTSPLIATGTVDGNGDSGMFQVSTASGNLTGALNGSVTVADLNSTTDPTGGTLSLANFIMFGSEPWTVELTQLQNGGAPATNCLATTGITSTFPNDFCTPPGTPFLEQNESCTGDGTIANTACQVQISFTFSGIANDGSGHLSNVSGTFSTTFSGTNYQTINTDIQNNQDVFTSDSGSLNFSVISGVPEPGTSLLVGAGLLTLGLVSRKRISKS